MATTSDASSDTRTSQRKSWDDLPAEIQIEILKHVYGPPACQHQIDPAPIESLLPPRIVRMPSTNNSSQLLIVSLRTQADFENLFVSRIFLMTALPLYARSTCVELMFVRRWGMADMMKMSTGLVANSLEGLLRDINHVSIKSRTLDGIRTCDIWSFFHGEDKYIHLHP